MSTARRRGTRTGAETPRPRLGLVLVVEDEQDVAELIRYHLTQGRLRRRAWRRPAPTPSSAPARPGPTWSCSTSWCRSSTAGRSAAASSRSRRPRTIPVIMVTGRVEEGDKVLGFEMGADDYVTKPFSPRELLARVRAVARRGRTPATGETKRITSRPASSRSTATASRSDEGPGRRAHPQGVRAPRDPRGRRRAACSAARSCWTWSGAATASWSPAPWTCTWPGCARSSSRAKLPVPGVETVRGVGYRFRDARRDVRNTAVTRRSPGPKHHAGA